VGTANQPPVINNLDGDVANGGTAYADGDAPVVLDFGSPANLTDADAPADFDGGTLRFEGDNDYAGLTTINDGILVAAHNGALGVAGAIGSGSETIVNGAELRLENNVMIVGEDVGLGSTFSSVGNNTFTGNILLTGDSVLQSDNGTFTINGTIDLNGFDLDFNPTNNGMIVINATITGAAGADLSHFGDGNTTLNADNSGSFLGSIDISNGTLIAANTGALGDKGGQTTVTPAARWVFRRRTSRKRSTFRDWATTRGPVR
jgi:autotransporter-associated beta strand protein